MIEDQGKKINYKILTAEEILQEGQGSAKEITHREEKIDIQVSPDSKKEEVKPIKEEQVREKIKEDIFYFRPKTIESSPEIITKPQITQDENIKKTSFKFNLKYLYFLIPGSVVLVGALFFAFQFYKKNPSFFGNNNQQEVALQFPTITVTTLTTPKATSSEISTTTEATTTETTTTPTTTIPIVFPTITVPTATEPKESVITSTENSEVLDKPITPPSKEINIPIVTQSVSKNQFDNFLSQQDSFGTKLNINLVDNNEKLPVNFIFDYFIKAKNKQELKNELTGNYNFVIYYGYVRKYPVLIFEIKDRNKVIKFNQDWEKTTMKDDLQTLFLGLKSPKTTKNFQSKTIDNFSYRILDFGDNYKIIWGVLNNYLIYTTTETGLKEMVNYLK